MDLAGGRTPRRGEARLGVGHDGHLHVYATGGQLENAEADHGGDFGSLPRAVRQAVHRERPLVLRGDVEADPEFGRPPHPRKNQHSRQRLPGLCVLSASILYC